ncbi:hypothetical protein C8R47DRAFT_1173249 [Mycena vitilis]|nr:hypothetical protein C8R47DRAFT_1173249 [Mycena vitilis]
MSSASSFDIVSSRSRSSTMSGVYDSDDEIVWGVSDGSLSSSESALSAEGSISFASDDDFVVLSRPRSPGASLQVHLPPPSNGGDDTPNNLASDLARLSVSQVSSIIRQKKRVAAVAKLQTAAAAKQNKNLTPTLPVSHSPQTPVSESATPRKGSPSGGKAVRRRRRNNNRSGSESPVMPGGFAARPIVDDVSEQPDSASERGDDDELAVQSMYDAAASYINSCLADPSSICRLTLLQSLIIELGLASSSLPASLTAAKNMIKSRVFLNVGEYLDARQQGPEAVQGIMHKSKSSLIRDLKKNRNHVSLRWVKETGLQVLLVRSRY